MSLLTVAPVLINNYLRIPVALWGRLVARLKKLMVLNWLFQLLPCPQSKLYDSGGCRYSVNVLPQTLLPERQFGARVAEPFRQCYCSCLGLSLEGSVLHLRGSRAPQSMPMLSVSPLFSHWGKDALPHYLWPLHTCRFFLWNRLLQTWSKSLFQGFIFSPELYIILSVWHSENEGT